MGFKDTFTAEVPREIIEDPEFTEWEDELDGSLFPRIEAALITIATQGLVTSAKDLNGGLYEKKWNRGLRLYFAIVQKNGKKTLLLLGSGKGGQAKAIAKARQVLNGYNVIMESIVKKV
jgi:putative component of toxin-antitoxin plasmid stabilization module